MSGALAVRGLQAVRGSKPVLRGVDLDVAPGEIVALMGVSGAGKSTVLRVVAALEPFTAGTVQAGGFALHPGPVPRESRLRELRARVGMVFQAHALFPHLTALQNVTLAPVHALGWAAEKADAVAIGLLDGLGVGARAGAYPRELSGGEAQRVAIARALAPDPMVLLMDAISKEIREGRGIFRPAVFLASMPIPWPGPAPAWRSASAAWWIIGPARAAPGSPPRAGQWPPRRCCGRPCSCGPTTAPT